MDFKDIDRLRDPGFSLVRRGYDRREVDRLLSAVADWLETDAATELGQDAVKRKLEYVGKSTARILLTTEEESAQLRRATQEECAQVRAEADAAALKTRQGADEYAKDVRAKADEDSRRRTDAARAKAKQLVEEGERRRAEIEAVVSALGTQRADAIQQLERLRAELSSTIESHKPDARSGERKAGAVAGA